MWTTSTSCLTSTPGTVTTGASARGQPAAGSAVQVSVSFYPKITFTVERTQYTIETGHRKSVVKGFEAACELSGL